MRKLSLLIPAISSIYASESTPLEIDFLMPTGYVIHVSVPLDTTYKDAKSVLWTKAREQLLFTRYVSQGDYVFLIIGPDKGEELVYDETQHISNGDFIPFVITIKVLIIEKITAEEKINFEISNCLGMSIEDINKANHESEVLTLRKSLISLGKVACEELSYGGTSACLKYLFSAEKNKKTCPIAAELLLRKDFIEIEVIFNSLKECDLSEFKILPLKFILQCSKSDLVLDTLSHALRRYYSEKINPDENIEKCIKQNRDLFALKIVSIQSYLFDLLVPLIKYQYIETCLLKQKRPALQLVVLEDTFNNMNISEKKFIMPSFVNKYHTSEKSFSSNRDCCLWTLENFFSVNIKSSKTYFSNKSKQSKLYISAAIYLGSHMLTTHKKTVSQSYSGNLNWNEKISFNLKLCDIPRSSRLCFSFVERIGTRFRKNDNPIFWVNMNIFDYLGFMHTGRFFLPLAPYDFRIEATNVFYPQGDVFRLLKGSDSIKTTSKNYIEVELDDYGKKSIAFPSNEKVSKYAESIEPIPNPQLTQQTQMPLARIKNIQNHINHVITKDQHSDFLEQDRQFLWKQREICLQMPDSLPRLSECVNWHSRKDVAIFHRLLSRWPIINIEISLQLLGPFYMDSEIRCFATKCLFSSLSDTDLLMYLLQIVQGLKCEPYLSNDLTTFLLKRALRNAGLGLKLYWHLRSEMHKEELRLRFGIILEAFCRGCGPLLHEISRQTEVLFKLQYLNKEIRKEKVDSQKSYFKTLLNDKDGRKDLENFTSPLNEHHRLEHILKEKCHIFGSKKRPFLITWKNMDELALNLEYKLIYKNGDDLRQDMFTIQLLHIMDEIWKEESMDMKLVPYSCLATGDNSGLIEAVSDAETVMQIQKKRLKSAIQIDPSQLHQWIKNSNPGELYDRAIDTFTRSCAGYCVATFVLGIRDRHPDNIMLNKSGQLFHIDFGHFLNNKKKKFGINRERVPFVLTEDFVYVIGKGGDQATRNEYMRYFIFTLSKAYLILRKHANLIINLFTMMINCGLPELTSVDDLQYLRKTLAVDSSEDGALLYFQIQMKSAFESAWTTKVDWFAHWLKHA